MWAFTSLEEARKFVDVRVGEYQAYLDLLKDQGPDPPEELHEDKEFSGALGEVRKVARDGHEDGHGPHRFRPGRGTPQLSLDARAVGPSLQSVRREIVARP